jgi:hypothetical protein|tara:strand:- start:617 stop:970 length:354 start_codon:yes stop_codon:yes gene_type:complete
MIRTFFATIGVIALANTASAACTYEAESTVNEDGQEQHRFFNDCGFYEVGYRLERKTLYFPRGGTHTLSEVPVSEAQSILTETYGLKDVGEGRLVRTKGLFASQDVVGNSSSKLPQK